MHKLCVSAVLCCH